jgi:hypothetical protein
MSRGLDRLFNSRVNVQMSCSSLFILFMVKVDACRMLLSSYAVLFRLRLRGFSQLA